MSDAMMAAANRLADVLVRENAVLRAMDITAAAVLAAEKSQALATLAAAGTGAGAAAHSPAVSALAGRLRDLASENRRLLETALAVQGRIMAVIAGAAARQAREATPNYGAGRPGVGRAPSPPPAAMAICARA